MQNQSMVSTNGSSGRHLGREMSGFVALAMKDGSNSENSPFDLVGSLP